MCPSLLLQVLTEMSLPRLAVHRILGYLMYFFDNSSGVGALTFTISESCDISRRSKYNKPRLHTYMCVVYCVEQYR